jgi:hypothetical protein
VQSEAEEEFAYSLGAFQALEAHPQEKPLRWKVLRMHGCPHLLHPIRTTQLRY